MDSTTKTLTSEQMIVQLARSFPSMEGRMRGLEPWDVREFMRSASGASHGEIVTVRFILGVWNTRTDWKKAAREWGLKNAAAFGRFDLFEAMNVWDEGHLEAFRAWARRPFFP